jgi:hydroxyacylglutathione hydrolase
MIILKTMNRSYLSNTWLVGDRPGGNAVVVDTGGPLEPIYAHIEKYDLTLTHVLCTHHHIDHISGNDEMRARFSIKLCCHEAEAGLIPGVDQKFKDGDRFSTGGLSIQVLHTPGHTAGQVAYLVDEKAVFTGDTLFNGSIGGTRAPGHTTFEDLHGSIMDRLMNLALSVTVHPGHTDSTTIAAEWDTNPFIRLWRGLDASLETPCTAMGRPATLMIRATDYDGGTKCQVRYEDSRVDVVPGSAVV